MPETLIGYARCSTDEQDLTAQQERLVELGVSPERIYLDHGLTGTNRARPGLDQALAAVREGDTLVVPKLDRLARSVPDARAIGDDLAALGIKLSLGGQVYDPTDPMGKMFFNILATFAEFEVDLLRMRTREGMAVARARGKLRGKQPKLSPKQQRELVRMAGTGEYTIADLAELFTVPARRSTGRFNGTTVRRAEEASAHTARSSAPGDMILTSTPGTMHARHGPAGTGGFRRSRARHLAGQRPLVPNAGLRRGPGTVPWSCAARSSCRPPRWPRAARSAQSPSSRCSSLLTGRLCGRISSIAVRPWRRIVRMP